MISGSLSHEAVLWSMGNAQGPGLGQAVPPSLVFFTVCDEGCGSAVARV